MQTFSGIDYIRIDVANQFGLDRLSWDDRLHWVNNNRPDLPRLSAQAEVPIAYDKAVRALICAETDVPTNHIMGLDATASGIQIMAALSGCELSAKAVNLIDTGKREDVYDTVRQPMSERVGQDIPRKKIKKPIMTFFYGSTRVPTQVFPVEEDLSAFYETMRAMLPGPYELMGVIQSHWDPCATEYSWAMPDGHVVHIPVTQKVDKGLELDEADHLRFTYRANVKKPQEEGRALAANLVHSIDGWVCREMVKGACEQGFYLATIHDCFYAHPNHMDQVRQLYRECLARVADMNMVTAILSQIKGSIVPYNKLSEGLSEKILFSEYALS
jgi:DNA-directed RNA polymerase